MNWTAFIERDKQKLEALHPIFRPTLARLGAAPIQGETRWALIHSMIDEAGLDPRLCLLLGGRNEAHASELARKLSLFSRVSARGVRDSEPLEAMEGGDALSPSAGRRPHLSRFWGWPLRGVRMGARQSAAPGE
jgi:hypothetical protein